ncbi:hypothetical protein ES705_17860 [subsurface metagenome]
MIFDDIKIYLPKYLSAESEKELFSELREFPNNQDIRLYTDFLKDEKIVFQGDGILEMLIINLPQPEIKPAPCVIISNACDISPDNVRNFPSNVLYAPLFNLQKYESSIREKSKKSNQQIENHINAIRKQEITQIFYLPAKPSKIEESIVFFDRINNCPNNYMDRKDLSKKRLFTLSDYGSYLFLLKMSIHFTRIRDGVERKTMKP